MSWIPLQALLSAPADRPVTLAPPLDLDELRQRALVLAGALDARGVRTLAVHLEDAADLAVALLGAWRAGARVLLPADLQPATRERLAPEVDLWLSDQPGDTRLDSLRASPLPAAELDLTHEGLLIATSGSSGQSKLIGKRLGQLASELQTLEQCWGADLGQALIVGSVSTQHIYGLLFRLLWPLCAGRQLAPRALPFAEDIQQASLVAPHGFAWVASPALLKRMGDNLDWPALAGVRRVFSSGGPLPAEAGTALQARLHQYPVEVYGSSETGGIAWRQGGSAWTPLPGVEIGQDSAGALRVTSPWLGQDSEQTADAVALLEDGRFVLNGRLDRIVKLEEKRISLPMLEAALAEHPFVAEARLGVVQENRASLGALVALSTAGLHALRNGGRRALTDTLRQHLARHCEALALPRRWRLLLQLPENPQGKLPQAQIDALLATPRPKTPERLAQHEKDGQWLLDLRVPADLAHFSGHFPQTPVLPGVVQVDWALNLARELLPLPAHYRGMEVLKFQQLVRPGDRIRLTLRFDAERSKLHFAFSQDDKPCSSGRILLGDAA